MSAVWWVNQGMTYAAEREAGILWAPKLNKSGQALSHWESMADVRPGDVIIHYSNGAIRAVGPATAAAVDAPRPAEVEGGWERDGRLVRCQYNEVKPLIMLGDIPEEWRTSEPAAGPFDRTGNVKQAYLLPVSPGLYANLSARFALPIESSSPRWVPNEQFVTEAERFRLWRRTADHWRDEVDYKNSLAGVLRRALSVEALATPGFAVRLAAVADGKATPEMLGLDAAERAAFTRWNYRQSWINLQGNAMAAAATLAALKAWADEVGDLAAAEPFQRLLYGDEDVASRAARFSAEMTRAFRELAAAGKVQSGKPAASLTFTCIFLGLTQPSSATLWRSGAYRRAAAAFGFDVVGEAAAPDAKVTASIQMQSKMRAAFEQLGIELRDMRDVHDFIWVRDTIDGWANLPIRRERQVVLVSADEVEWERWRSAGRVSFRLEGLDDLRWYGSPDKLPASWLREDGGRRLSVDEAWILRSLEPGDIVAVASPGRGVVGHGVASSTYSFDAADDGAAHGVDVHWRSTSASALETPADEAAISLMDEAWLAERLGVSDWWIFQGNPELYRLGDAVRALPAIAYEVNQSPNQIHAEHRVVLYESGEAGGIVAAGTIVTEPATFTEPAFERRFWGKDSTEHDGQARLRVRLRVDRVIDPRVPRDELRAHPVLRELPQLKFASGTNYHVDAALVPPLLARLEAQGGPDFDREWESLVGWVQAAGRWDTLGQHSEISLVDADSRRVRYISSGPDSGVRSLTKEKAKLAWDDARAKGFTEAGDLQRAPKALLARLPNIEYSLQPMLLHWVDPGTHALGTLKARDERIAVPAKQPEPDFSRTVSELIAAAVEAAGLYFERWQVDDVYLALRTKPFLLLTGLSGTGKTQLARVLQSVLCEPGTAEVVSVRPDWTDSRSLLGYHNLLSDRFHSTPVTRFLLAADTEWRERGSGSRPYILLLDEMNLARVEHYLADYLSALEMAGADADGRPAGHPMQLHGAAAELKDAEAEGLMIPATVTLAPNLYLIGTVNVDETTHPFSRKVLDRATTIELFDVDLSKAGRRGESGLSDRHREQVRAHFIRDGLFADSTEPALDKPWIDWLVEINEVLARYRLHVGYRVRNEVLRFVAQAGDEGLLGMDRTAAQRTAFDLAVLQKVLPRLAGSRERLERPLAELLAVCLEAGASRSRLTPAAILQADYDTLYASLAAIAGGNGQAAAVAAARSAIAETDNEGEDAPPAGQEQPAAQPAMALSANDVRLPRSAKKLARLLVQLRDEGYASFFE